MRTTFLRCCGIPDAARTVVLGLFPPLRSFYCLSITWCSAGKHRITITNPLRVYGCLARPLFCSPFFSSFPRPALPMQPGIELLPIHELLHDSSLTSLGHDACPS